ncbi:MAG TPA: amino acid racemase [Candidatus Corynebacterium avicola]|uniref:Amino acid racemase n=1 Tax=Candidatus Corynebacterium avicola TaxID=2838527 RepID=A0A9D1ULB5_9CORY|nr:amino acid racemase [Candidatus Corynebacterium avicola]
MDTTARKLGLIGGTGPESTLLYYRALTTGVQERCGEDVLPRLTVESLSHFEVFRFLGAGDTDGLADYFSAAVDNLAAAGAQVVSLSAITPHIIFDRLAERSPVPLVSAVETVRDEAVARSARRVLLLGTGFTMAPETNGFFLRPFAEADIEVVVPGEEDREEIHRRIATELEFGTVTEETRERFVQIITGIHEVTPVDQVVLGCTELPMVLDDEVSPVPCLDTVGIHTRALVDAMVGSARD